MTMPSGATWIGAHLVLNHPVAACCVCLAVGTPAYMIASSEVGDPTVVLTLDDATSSQIVHGLPIAQEYGIEGTLYVPTQSVIQEGDDRGWFMTTADVAAFDAAGWELGSHTLIHENLLEVGPTAALATMQGSDFQLRSLVGDVDQMTFSYPYGAFDEVIETLSSTIYDYSVNAWSDANGLNVPATFEEHNIHRFDIFDQAAAEYACGVVNDLQEHQTFVVIVHEIVEENPADYQITTDTYRYLLDCIADSHVTTKTLLEAANDLLILRDYGDPEQEVTTDAPVAQTVAPVLAPAPVADATPQAPAVETPATGPVDTPADLEPVRKTTLVDEDGRPLTSLRPVARPEGLVTE